MSYRGAACRRAFRCLAARVHVQPEVVFHLAGCVTGGRGLEAVLPTLEHDLHAAVNLLTALTELDCGRIVLAGSLEELAESGPKET